MTRQIVEEIVPEHWDTTKDIGAGSGFNRVRWLQQGVVDTLHRPILNRLNITAPATAVTLTGAPQSTGVGVGPIMPKKYAEFTVKARVSFNISAPGALYVSVYRTTGSIPANGSNPNTGDVVVGGDAFAGPALVGGQNTVGSLSFIDTGLSVTQAYRYYLAFNGTAGLVGNLSNTSQLFVLERS